MHDENGARMTMRSHWRPTAVTLACALAIAAACAHPPPAATASSPLVFELAAFHIVPSPPREAKGPQFNGISALAPLREGHEMLALSDDREDSRVYRIGFEWTTTGTYVKPLQTILFQRGGTAPVLDPEGIAVTRDGHMLVSSEGIGNQEPRVPPALIEYGPDGRFVRQLPVRPRYVPNERGEQTTGVRANAGFESLTLSPDYSKLFTAAELPLTQDGTADPFRPSRTRLLEYEAAGDSYKPSREFVYELAPLEPVAYPHRFAINGVVELLALDDREMLVMERGFVESTDRTQTLNRIRIFRISTAGATDVSGYDSLRDASGATPVTKTLVLDVNRARGLDPRLADLDNFEGMAWGPALTRGGKRPLVLVSDDNESVRQVTAFLVFKR